MHINPKLKHIPQDWLAEPTEVTAAQNTASEAAVRYKELFKKSEHSTENQD